MANRERIKKIVKGIKDVAGTAMASPWIVANKIKGNWADRTRKSSTRRKIYGEYLKNH